MPKAGGDPFAPKSKCIERLEYPHWLGLIPSSHLLRGRRQLRKILRQETRKLGQPSLRRGVRERRELGAELLQFCNQRCIGRYDCRSQRQQRRDLGLKINHLNLHLLRRLL